MAEVFINYRTGDGDEAAEHIASSLSERFGEEHVFKAARSLEPGELFGQALIDAAQKSTVLLAVMGQEWASAPQLRDEGDWVRKEILAAQSSGSSVVPVLKGRTTDRLVRDDLPPELRWLADVQSLRLDMQNSIADIKRIGDFLADLTPALKAADRSAGDTATADATANTATDVTGTLFQGRDFTGDVMNASDTNAPVQQGDGNVQLNLLMARLRALQRLTQPIDHLRLLAERFVPPRGFDDAQAALKVPGTVVLEGPPGSGRTAAAKMLAFRSWAGEREPHELIPQEPDDESTSLVDPDLIGRHDHMWMNLSDAEPRLWQQIQKELPVLHGRVLEREARLVVIKPDWLELPADFRHHLRRIEAPPQGQVFGRLLLAEGLLHGEQTPATTFLDSTRSMDDIRQFVGDILDAKDQADGAGGLADWIKAAEQPVSPRETRVRQALLTLPSAAERALLLTVAMLHGAHADVIDNAATKLLARLPDESDAGLTRSPLGERLRKIEAEADTARHVRFVRSGYEASVRSYFWRHFPELHDPLADWVGETLIEADLTDNDRTELARGFASQCLDGRYRLRWKGLVERLTAQRASPSRELAAASILQVGLGDDANGRTFRHQVYDWSRAGDASGSLVTVLVAACRQMAETHPDEALVRLHHLARRHPGRDDVRATLADAARGSLRTLRLLLSRFAGGRSNRIRVADAGIFLGIADPAFLTASATPGKPPIAHGFIAGQLAADWTLTFTVLPAEKWAARAHDWLSRAADDVAGRHALVNVLIDGARPIPAVMPQLYEIAHRAESREMIADLVLRRISAVQGVELP